MRKPEGEDVYWTHPSVAEIARHSDPVDYVLERALHLVFDAVERGWGGPPFDPFSLAQMSRIQLIPTEDVIDARTLPARGGRLQIEYNANRPKNRVRFSVAHEIAHSLFPDCRDYVRERQSRQQMRGDDWQLEMLCNVAAAEFLMPIGSFPELGDAHLSIDELLELRKQYEVSMEAVLLRSVRLTESPCLVFCCSRRGEGTGRMPYIVDYGISSKATSLCINLGMQVPGGSVVEECTAIGYTAKGDERWPNRIGSVHVECVGLPPYPSQHYPRVAGVLSIPRQKGTEANRIRYLKGDATEPRGEGRKIIAFVVNDKGRSWGAGFARAVQTKWPCVLEGFQAWIAHHPSQFTLGNVNVTRVDSAVKVVELIAQHGYGDSPSPRIRYDALEKCLEKLADEAGRWGASVHMPRIGCGQAGGSWWIVSELIESAILRRGVNVTIYDLPERKGRKKCEQMSFLRGGT